MKKEEEEEEEEEEEKLALFMKRIINIQFQTANLHGLMVID